MKKNDLTALLKELGIAPSKKMGQNFLIDDNFIDYILREADPKPGQTVLEVGPGLGALTGRILESGAFLTAIEFDRKLAEWLRNTLVPRGLNLIEGDACRVDCAELLHGGDFRVISNLPYSAGTVFVADMLDLDNPPVDFFIMLQKEVAERFAAQPGNSEYSALTVRMQALYRVELLKVIPPEVFFPKPEIDSAILRMTRIDPLPPKNLRVILSRLARTSFAHRRKKMFKQTASVFGVEETRAAMESAGVDPDIRAERVTVAQFLKMAETLAPAVC